MQLTDETAGDAGGRAFQAGQFQRLAERLREGEFLEFEFVTAVRAAQSPEERDAAVQERARRQGEVYSRIVADVTAAFRHDSRRREITRAILEHL